MKSTGLSDRQPHIIPNCDMKTAEQRIQALAAIVPIDVIEFLKAHLCIKNTIETTFTHYANAFESDTDVNGKDLFLTDNCAMHLEGVETALWSRACTALENWIYETYYD